MQTVLVNPLPRRAGTRHALPQGTILQQYTIQELLSEDVHGYTYRAYNRQMEYEVTIREHAPEAKVTRRAGTTTILITTDKADFEYSRDQFRERARQLSTVCLPAGVPVIHEFAAHGTAYCVCPALSDAKNLASMSAQRRELTEERLRNILKDLLLNLDELHTDGVIHGAISATAIQVLKNGMPTFSYYADSTQGKSAADDLRALGATLYELLTGHQPSTYAGNVPLLSRQDSLQSVFSQQLLATIDKAISPNTCWQSAKEWLNALDNPITVTVGVNIGTRSANTPAAPPRTFMGDYPQPAQPAPVPASAAAAPPRTVMGGYPQSAQPTPVPASAPATPPRTFMGDYPQPAQPAPVPASAAATPPRTVMGGYPQPAQPAPVPASAPATPPRTFMGDYPQSAQPAPVPASAPAAPPRTFMGDYSAPVKSQAPQRPTQIQEKNFPEPQVEVEIVPLARQRKPAAQLPPLPTPPAPAGTGQTNNTSCLAIILWVTVLPFSLWGLASYLL